MIWLMRASQFCVACCVPVALVHLGLGLLLSPSWLSFTYTRADFPSDPYGFSVDDRLRYGTLALAFIRENQPVAQLAAQTLDGAHCFPPQSDVCPLYTPRELQHLVDVQQLAQAIRNIGSLTLGLLGLSVLALIAMRAQRRLWHALVAAALGSIIAVFTVLFVALVAWDTFFDTFHALFFEDGTWRFFYSDTLIRLYPERFWFDSALAFGGFLVFASLTLLFISLHASKSSVLKTGLDSLRFAFHFFKQEKRHVD